ncbi:cell wall metabolism sensor histidine kinase WalK [Marinoscillum sp. 108]|jgi:two-component system, OmpR family, phosphate regulon sensor histidine kinase PhoR|uniref:histidine kinase n=1 Tax=Marinoscillum luteum TaxID=861051 RepID=A0ABW7NB34_9BACT|nr:ATP-binding protein [Marinoscillum sp. 108]VXD19848.1 Two-component sensor histidine kinase [Marinoscillum sp. 108]
MIINSRGLALMLAFVISMIATAFLALVPSVLTTALIIGFGITFCASYILIRLVLEFLFFRHINDINEALENFQDQELSNITKPTKTLSLNPLKRINKDIFSYAEKKQQEILELKRMEVFRREFIADVSHELKTPIFAAQGFVHTLLDGAVEDKKVRGKFLKKAAKSLDGLDILVQDLLTISQMETGEIKMHVENFDIVALAREVLDQLEDKAEKQKIDIQIEEPTARHFVKGDYRRIYQVLINLMSNAIKYTKKKGTVRIRFEEKDNHVITSVVDNGRGIPQEDLKRIFERFYRVEKSRSKEKGGTGLGLAIVKHIMEGHGSTVEVKSQVKKGSTFSFKLKKGKPVAHRFVEEDEEDEEDYA